MMSYCNNISGGQQGGGGGPLEGSPTPPHMAHCANNNSSPTASGKSRRARGPRGPAEPPRGLQLTCLCAPVAGAGDGEEEVWRGHSIAALRRRASELSAAIPPYLQLNYDAHSPVY